MGNAGEWDGGGPGMPKAGCSRLRMSLQYISSPKSVKSERQTAFLESRVEQDTAPSIRLMGVIDAMAVEGHGGMGREFGAAQH